MKSQPHTRWWLVLAALAAVVAVAWLGRSHASRWTHERLASQYREKLASQSESQAARLIERLAEADDEYLDLVVHALADARLPVAEAAQAALLRRLEAWSLLPTRESSRRVAALATLLVRIAPDLSGERRGFAQHVAQRLLMWPVDSRLVDSGQLIGDCETVLRLPSPGPEEVRVAARTAPIVEETQPADPPQPVRPKQLTRIEDPPLKAVQPTPRVIFSQEPEPLPDASRETAQTPRRLIAPKAMRISDEE
jgi:hypothetical protein